jgi:7-carboxy-7-deazaguanine synthase
MSKLLSHLRISELFYSLQGESTTVGLPTVFIRLTGCPLRCTYCDTEYAFKGGQRMAIDEVLAQVKQYKTRHVCVTGGEPLAQPGCQSLLTLLCEQGYNVSIETSGAFDIGGIDPRVMIVMDLKTPDSGEVDKNLFANLGKLKTSDQIKFVICSRQDYEWARELFLEHKMASLCHILFSPSWEQINPTQLADWILEDELDVRFQLQLHKVLWNDEPGR